ncbi:hypothetical protein BDV09DRAFT_18714 [Aspergillus tetrazonus]
MRSIIISTYLVHSMAISSIWLDTDGGSSVGNLRYLGCNGIDDVPAQPIIVQPTPPPFLFSRRLLSPALSIRQKERGQNVAGLREHAGCLEPWKPRRGEDVGNLAGTIPASNLGSRVTRVWLVCHITGVKVVGDGNIVKENRPHPPSDNMSPRGLCTEARMAAARISSSAAMSPRPKSPDLKNWNTKRERLGKPLAYSFRFLSLSIQRANWPERLFSVKNN